MDLPAVYRPARPVSLAAGTVLHRLHHVDLPGAGFNPCRGGATRFAPLHRPDDGACIPTLYAATTFDGAAYETVFRGPPGPFAAVPRQDLETRAASRIAPRVALDLVPLFTPELAAAGLDPAALFRPSASVYGLCRALALTAWRDNPAAHGLIWTSVRDNAAQAMLLFGDRLGADAFDTLDRRTIATHPDLLDAFVETAARGGYRISR